MAKLLSIFLLVIFSIQLSLPLLWYGAYQLNMKTWTEEYCENVTKPEIDCKAKCFFNKKIEETQDQSSTSDAVTSKVRVDKQWNFSFNNEIVINVPFQNQVYYSLQEKMDLEVAFSIFHPPKS